MDHLRFDAITSSFAPSRRSALAVLLATASGLAGRTTSAARRNGPDCAGLAEQRCASDVETCRAMLAGYCLGQAGCLAIATCCATCAAEGMLTCLLAHMEMPAARLAPRQNGGRHA